MDVLQHVVQNGGHLDEVTHVAAGQLTTASLHTLGHAHDQVADALQVGDALQACQQLASFSLVDAGNGAG